MPMGAIIPEGQLTEQQASSAVLTILADAERAFESYLADREQTGNVEDVRDAAMSIALLKVYRSSLGQNASALTSDTVNLLGMCLMRLRRVRTAEGRDLEQTKAVPLHCIVRCWKYWILGNSASPMNCFGHLSRTLFASCRACLQ